jgi:hypothetical protein
VFTAQSLPPPALQSAAAIIACVTRIAVVADDLIWASRLTDAVRRAGAEPRPLTATAALADTGVALADTSGALESGDHDAQARTAATEGCDGAIVDMALMTADPMIVIAALHGLGLPVLAVANHDDVAIRKRALAAGAGKVLAYRKLHDDGPATIAAWIESRPTQTRGVSSR